MRVECQKKGDERRYIIPGPLDRSSVAALDMLLPDRELFPEKTFEPEEKIIIDLSPLDELGPQGAGALLKLCGHIFELLPSDNSCDNPGDNTGDNQGEACRKPIEQKPLTLLYKAPQIGMLLSFCQFDSICNLVLKTN